MHTDLDKALGETLRKMRQTTGLTQVDAADVLGVTQPTIARWERGTVTMDANNIACAATLYGSTPAQVYAEPAVQEATQSSVPDQVTARAQSLAKSINQRHGR